MKNPNLLGLATALFSLAACMPSQGGSRGGLSGVDASDFDSAKTPWTVDVESSYRDQATGESITIKGRGFLMELPDVGLRLITATHVAGSDLRFRG